MSALLTRPNGIIALTPAADYSNKKGYLGTFAGDIFTVSASATVPAKGVILEPNRTAEGFANEQVTVGLLGMGGTAQVKTSGAITKGAFVQQAADGTIVTDAGSGARVLVGIALESGESGDLIEAQLLGAPVIYAS